MDCEGQFPVAGHRRTLHRVGSRAARRQAGDRGRRRSRRRGQGRQSQDDRLDARDDDGRAARSARLRRRRLPAFVQFVPQRRARLRAHARPGGDFLQRSRASHAEAGHGVQAARADARRNPARLFGVRHATTAVKNREEGDFGKLLGRARSLVSLSVPEPGARERDRRERNAEGGDGREDRAAGRCAGQQRQAGARRRRRRRPRRARRNRAPPRPCRSRFRAQASRSASGVRPATRPSAALASSAMQASDSDASTSVASAAARIATEKTSARPPETRRCGCRA